MTKQKKAIITAVSLLALMGFMLLLFMLYPLVFQRNQRDINELAVGECLETFYDGISPTVKTIDCNEEHAQEVFLVAKQALANFESYPSPTEIDELVRLQCEGSFEYTLATEYEVSLLKISALYPSEEVWEKGDRRIVCLAGNQDGTLLNTSIVPAI